MIKLKQLRGIWNVDRILFNQKYILTYDLKIL